MKPTNLSIKIYCVLFVSKVSENGCSMRPLERQFHRGRLVPIRFGCVEREGAFHLCFLPRPANWTSTRETLLPQTSYLSNLQQARVVNFAIFIHLHPVSTIAAFILEHMCNSTTVLFSRDVPCRNSVEQTTLLCQALAMSSLAGITLAFSNILI